MTKIVIPPSLAETILPWFGDDGRRWLNELPDIVATLAEKWQLTLGEPYEGGSNSLVLQATDQNNVPLVLKIPCIDEENRTESAALQHYAGDGAVMLFDFDLITCALLEERLNPGVALSELPDRTRAIDIACSLMRRLWKTPKEPHPFPFVHELAAKWANSLPLDFDKHNRPFSQSLIESAISIAQEFAKKADENVVVNRDAHLGNFLSAEREPWLLIDPKPLVGDKAFDAGFLLLDLLGNNPNQAKARALTEMLATNLRVEKERVRKWSFLRAVENALWSIDVGSNPANDIALACSLKT